MQFINVAAVLAFAASVSAVAIEARGGGTVCKGKDGSCKPEDPSKCTASGGQVYKCGDIGLINALDCIAILNGVEVGIPISIPITL